MRKYRSRWLDHDRGLVIVGEGCICRKILDISPRDIRWRDVHTGYRVGWEKWVEYGYGVVFRIGGKEYLMVFNRVL
jgi:hypothetical protein